MSFSDNFLFWRILKLASIDCLLLESWSLFLAACITVACSWTKSTIVGNSNHFGIFFQILALLQGSTCLRSYSRAFRLLILFCYCFILSRVYNCYMQECESVKTLPFVPFLKQKSCMWTPLFVLSIIYVYVSHLCNLEWRYI